MGTKLECAINPLASSQNSNSCTFTVHLVDDYYSRARGLKENCQKIGLARFWSSMDRSLLERHKMESIRNTMQVHEDIFKHQVRELHRLYNVQRMLMAELKKENKKNRFWTTPMTSSDINQSQVIKQQQLTTQITCEYNLHVQGHPRSGNCCGDLMKIGKGFDLERSDREDISATEATAVEGDQATGPSSLMHSRINQMSIEGSDEDREVELTLGIGFGGSSLSSRKKMPKNSKPQSHELGCTSSQSIHKEIARDLDSSASFKSNRDREEDCSGLNTPISSSRATFDQERKLPPWLSQGLSINRI